MCMSVHVFLLLLLMLPFHSFGTHRFDWYMAVVLWSWKGTIATNEWDWKNRRFRSATHGQTKRRLRLLCNVSENTRSLVRSQWIVDETTQTICVLYVYPIPSYRIRVEMHLLPFYLALLNGLLVYWIYECVCVCHVPLITIWKEWRASATSTKCKQCILMIIVYATLTH